MLYTFWKGKKYIEKLQVFFSEFWNWRWFYFYTFCYILKVLHDHILLLWISIFKKKINVFFFTRLTRSLEFWLETGQKPLSIVMSQFVLLENKGTNEEFFFFSTHKVFLTYKWNFWIISQKNLLRRCEHVL